MKIKEILFSVSFVMFLISNMAVAQENETKPKKVRLKLEYIKLPNGTKVLNAKMYWKDGKEFNAVVDQDVMFVAVGDSVELKLATIKSNKEGFAKLYIEKDFKFPINEEGFTSFTAKMNKSTQFKRAKKTINIKDAELDFTLNEIDSVKIIELNVSSFGTDGEIVPVNRAEVNVYVKRLHSLYEIKKGATNENGFFSAVFPEDMPGDSTGNVTIIVKVLDSDDYGTIEKVQNIKWGTIVSYAEEEHVRTLWTGEAPVWMIIAVCVILLGAWFNFALAIYKVSKIKNAV